MNEDYKLFIAIVAKIIWPSELIHPDQRCRRVIVTYILNVVDNINQKKKAAIILLIQEKLLIT